MMIAGIGISLAIMSRALILFLKERESEDFQFHKEYENLASFLNTWTRFERTSKDLLAKNGEDFNRHSLRSVISKLFEEGKINKEDKATLEAALQARNSIVHGQKTPPFVSTEKITDSLYEIIKKIVASQ